MDARITLVNIKPGTEQDQIRESILAIKFTIERVGNEWKKVCFMSEGEHGKPIANALARALPNIEYSYANGDWSVSPNRNNGPEAGFTDTRYDAVVALCPPQRLHGLVRYVHHCFTGQPPVIATLPGSPGAGRTTIEETRVALGPQDPIVVMLYPGAGSARLRPVFSFLMNLRLRPYWPAPTQSFVRRFIETRIDPNHEITEPQFGRNLISQDAIDDAYYNMHMVETDYYQWSSIHDPVSTSMLSSLDGKRIVYLYRDPRDILNSIYHRLAFDGVEEDFGRLRSRNKEEVFLDLFEGMDYVNSRRNYFLRWPSLQEMARGFVQIRDSSNIYGIKYEDIRYHPRAAYRSLMKWLQLEDLPLAPPLTDALLDEAIHRGTFEAQSQGAVREGEGDGQKTYRDRSGAVTPLRKGISGDWKNNFSPKVKDIAKERIGDALIELGYERDLNW